MKAAPKWARGNFVFTVGRDEQLIREYIRRQSHADEKAEQLKDTLINDESSVNVAPFDFQFAEFSVC